MPVNYQELRKQMKAAGQTLRLRQEAASRASDFYEAVLRTEAVSADLKERISDALTARPDTRCAIPGEESIDSVHPLPPIPPVQIRLLACDGSQISPSRHDEITFGLINTAVVEFIAHSGQTPLIRTRTQLLDFDNLPSEDQLGIRRDAEEKRFLAECAAESDRTIPTYAVCDGPLELFSQTPEIREYRQLQAKYLEALTQLAESKVPVVGYIDRPRSDPVLKMLDLLENKLTKEEKNSAVDSMIFSRLLGPGERSAVFGINTGLNSELDESLRLCFFYLNVGRPDHPYISRVELPAWAAEPPILDLLHAVLMEQCRLLGGHPYPFVLHRAHECAVITMAEKEEVKGLLLREIALNGMPVPEKSNKQIAKDLSRLTS